MVAQGRSRARHILARSGLRPALAAVVVASSAPQGFFTPHQLRFVSWCVQPPLLRPLSPLLRRPMASYGAAGTDLSRSMAAGAGAVGMAVTGGQASSPAEAGSGGPTTSEQDLREAAEMRDEAKASGASVSDAAFAELPAVVIDEGAFKYVLMKVSTASGTSRYLVRGTEGAAYHKDVALPYMRAYLAQGFQVEILGGGRISHQKDEKKIMLYGFSYGFPWEDGAGHFISCMVCRGAFPGYSVEWSDEGY
mmetsp:Transcript_38280/g.108507  ORF Transcript_38280/g.108507 Transcript_38280/m.108507 type:complete len:250 (+) Transcript_38280:69-818(+)